MINENKPIIIEIAKLDDIKYISRSQNHMIKNDKPSFVYIGNINESINSVTKSKKNVINM